MRVDRYRELIFLKDREDLAKMVGTLLGCHDTHNFHVNVAQRSITMQIEELDCASNAQIPYRLTLTDRR